MAWRDQDRAGQGARVLPPPPVRRRPDFSLATVNIVLLLVLFFLVAGSIVSEDERFVDLPKTLTLPLENLPRPLLVIAADGALAHEGRAIAPEDLGATVSGTEKLYVMAARDLPANALLRTVASVAAEGVAVSLVTIRHDPGAPP